MKDKIIQFKRSTESVYLSADKKCDEGDYIGALSSLIFESLKNAENADVCAHIADIYTELELYENAICFWFKYLLRAKKKFYCDGFNGLGANYYFTGDKDLAGYYFGEQIKNDNGEPSVYEEVLETFRDEILSEKPNIRLVKDATREEIDSEILEKAKDYNKSGAYEKAIDLLNSIMEDSPIYGESLSEIAFSYFCLNKIDESVKYVQKSIRSGFVSVNSLTFAIHLYISTETEGAEDLLELLVNLQVETLEDKYKKLVALCEFYLYEDANDLADEILFDSPYDVNTNFIKAFLSYNNGDYSTAEQYFKKAYILSCNSIALFYLKLSERAVSGDVKYSNLKISFDLPTDEIENINQIIKDILESKTKVTDYSSQRMIEIAEWCFTCGSHSSQIAISVIFAKSENEQYKKYLNEQLVSPSVSDEVKLRIVSLLCEYSDFKQIKVVYGQIFKEIKVIRPEFQEEKELIFKKAYSFAFGRLSAFETKRLHLLELGAIELQKELVSCKNIDKVSDIPTLACAMYFYSGMNTFKDSSVTYKLFDVKKSEVVKIIKLTENKTDDN